MNNGHKYHGTVVPMVTPLTAAGGLDETALERLIDAQVAAGVEGIFVLGTTGEGAHIPAPFRVRLVERSVRQVAGRTRVFAGLGDVGLHALGEAGEFFQAGVDAVVVHPPIAEPVPADQLHAWYTAVLDALPGPMLLYNMPVTTGVSIPLDTVASLRGHPRLAGIKDSENNPARLAELLRRFGGIPDFAVFVGVGSLMEQGLQLGADGIVPSVGNLIPEICQQMCAAAKNTDWPRTANLNSRMSAVSAIYQKGRTLNESLAALKAALYCRGVCAPHVLPPLRLVPAGEMESIRHHLQELQLLPV
jgi:dihydrodipicolinate synthase/N-acetylneuraminate lyase